MFEDDPTLESIVSAYPACLTPRMKDAATFYLETESDSETATKVVNLIRVRTDPLLLVPSIQ